MAFVELIGALSFMALIYSSQTVCLCVKFVFCVFFIYAGAIMTILNAKIFNYSVKKGNPLFAWPLYRATLFAMKFVGNEVVVVGGENAVMDSGAVLMINHQSALDVTVGAALFKVYGNVVAIGKHLSKYLFPLSQAGKVMGMIYINRADTENAKDIINSEVGQRLQGKAKILIFPEGTRNNNGTLLPFKKGGFHVAVTHQCPIQPVVVRRYHLMQLGKMSSGSVEILVKILPPVSTKGLTAKDIPQLVEKLKAFSASYLSKLIKTSGEKKALTVLLIMCGEKPWTLSVKQSLSSKSDSIYL